MTTVLLHAASTTVTVGGQSIVALYPPQNGGIIANPPTAEDQGIAIAEPLFVSLTGTATPYESASTFALYPGQSISVVVGSVLPVWVNAATSGHKFSAVFFAKPPQYPPRNLSTLRADDTDESHTCLSL